MVSVARKLKDHYRYKDYLTWDDGERWEIMDGEAYNMSPAPTLKHQQIVGNFYSILKRKLKGKKCIPFVSPVDVVLSDDNVVQPDVVVVCNPKIIQEQGVFGAPTLVIEVLSASTAEKDKHLKKALYERSGVQEYLIVYPNDKFLERFYLTNGKYLEADIFSEKQKMELKSLDIALILKQVFESVELKQS